MVEIVTEIKRGPDIDLSNEQYEIDNAISEFIKLDKQKAEIKKFYEAYDAAVDKLVELVDVGYHFKDEDGTVYQLSTCEWKNVKMTPFIVKRTRRDGERQGDLSLTAARELGYEVEGK